MKTLKVYATLALAKLKVLLGLNLGKKALYALCYLVLSGLQKQFPEMAFLQGVSPEELQQLLLALLGAHTATDIASLLLGAMKNKKLK
jgi:hypothetical protein